MPKAIICPHCGSSKLDISDAKDSQNFYQCKNCEVYIDPRTTVDKAIKKTNSIILGLTKIGLLVLAIDDTENILDLVEDIIE